MSWRDTTSSFDESARLPEVQTISPPAPVVNPTSVEWAIRGCVVIALLLLVVVPVGGVGFAAWLFQSSLAPTAASARAYRNAPSCSEGAVPPSCVREEYATLLSLYHVPGRFGSHTDFLSLQLSDGPHQVEVAFDIRGPRVNYGSPSGVRVREYRGVVTTVFTDDGKALETVDSPAGGNPSQGIAIVMAAFLIPWLLLVVYGVIRHPGSIRDVWKLLRKGRLVEASAQAPVGG
jgi:hypothetical protein